MDGLHVLSTVAKVCMKSLALEIESKSDDFGWQNTYKKNVDEQYQMNYEVSNSGLFYWKRTVRKSLPVAIIELFWDEDSDCLFYAADFRITQKDGINKDTAAPTVDSLLKIMNLQESFVFWTTTTLPFGSFREEKSKGR